MSNIERWEFQYTVREAPLNVSGYPAAGTSQDGHKQKEQQSKLASFSGMWTFFKTFH